MKIKMLISVTIFFLSATAVLAQTNLWPDAEPLPTAKTFSLPENLKKELERKYPKFRTADKKDYCHNIEKLLPFVAARTKDVWAYGLIESDFNADGRMDYSVIISYPKSERRYTWLGAVQKQDGGYEVEEFGEPGHVGERTPKVKYKNGKICDGILNLMTVEQMVQSPWEKIDEPMRSQLQKISTNQVIAIANDGAAEIFYYVDGKWHNDFSYEP